MTRWLLTTFSRQRLLLLLLLQAVHTPFIGCAAAAPPRCRRGADRRVLRAGTASFGVY